MTGGGRGPPVPTPLNVPPNTLLGPSHKCCHGDIAYDHNDTVVYRIEPATNYPDVKKFTMRIKHACKLYVKSC